MRSCTACSGTGETPTGIGTLPCDECGGTGIDVKGTDEYIKTLEALSVTHILLEVVPGYDGWGQEVYAKSVEDVVRTLTHKSELIEDLLRERDHWKANHDNQVQRARILLERPDMPLERVKAYHTVIAANQRANELEQQMAETQAALEHASQRRIHDYLVRYNLRSAVTQLLSWIDDWAETGPDTDFEKLHQRVQQALTAHDPAPDDIALMPLDLSMHDEAITAGCDAGGLYRVDFINAWRAAAATLKEKPNGSD